MCASLTGNLKIFIIILKCSIYIKIITPLIYLGLSKRDKHHLYQLRNGDHIAHNIHKHSVHSNQYIYLIPIIMIYCSNYCHTVNTVSLLYMWPNLSANTRNQGTRSDQTLQRYSRYSSAPSIPSTGWTCHLQRYFTWSKSSPYGFHNICHHT